MSNVVSMLRASSTNVNNAWTSALLASSACGQVSRQVRPALTSLRSCTPPVRARLTRPVGTLGSVTFPGITVRGKAGIYRPLICFA